MKNIWDQWQCAKSAYFMRRRVNYVRLRPSHAPFLQTNTGRLRDMYDAVRWIRIPIEAKRHDLYEITTQNIHTVLARLPEESQNYVKSVLGKFSNSDNTLPGIKSKPANLSRTVIISTSTTGTRATFLVHESPDIVSKSIRDAQRDLNAYDRMHHIKSMPNAQTHIHQIAAREPGKAAAPPTGPVMRFPSLAQRRGIKRGPGDSTH